MTEPAAAHKRPRDGVTAQRRPAGSGSVYQRKNGSWCGQIDLGFSSGRRDRRTVYAPTRAGVEAKILALLASPEAVVTTRLRPTTRCAACGTLVPTDDLFRQMCGACYPWEQMTDLGVAHPKRPDEWREFACLGCGAMRWTRQPDVAECCDCLRRTSDERRAARLAEADAIASHDTAAWVAKRQAIGCCVYCGSLGPLVIDHAVPISRGGDNSIANIVPACVPCNSEKGQMTAAEFIAARLR